MVKHNHIMMDNQIATIGDIFDHVNYLILTLPTYTVKDTFYNIVDIRTLKAKAAWELVVEKLLKIASLVPKENENSFKYYAADVYIGLNYLENALKIIPKPLLGSTGSLQTSKILSLKFALGKQITGNDVATLFGAKLTAFGKKNIISITEFLDVKLQKLQRQDNRNILQEWIYDAYKYPEGTPLFWGIPKHILVRQPTLFSFDHSLVAQKMCQELMREAENIFREEQDLPYVGEGWISETALFYEIKKAFPTETVIQHGRPEWLGRQHLDVYLPDRGIALEYQGIQHDKPIAFFGGEESFLKNVQRDKKKLIKCKKNGVRIIYVRQGYSLSTIIDDIVTIK